MSEFASLQGSGRPLAEHEHEQALSSTVFSAISGIFSKGAARIHPLGADATEKYRVPEAEEDGEAGYETAVPKDVEGEAQGDGTDVLAAGTEEAPREKRKLLSFTGEKPGAGRPVVVGVKAQKVQGGGGDDGGGDGGAGVGGAGELYQRCKALTGTADASEISDALDAVVAALQGSSKEALGHMFSIAVLELEEEENDPWTWFILAHVLCSCKRAAEHFVSTTGFQKVLKANRELTNGMAWGLGDFAQVFVEQQQLKKEWNGDARSAEDAHSVDKETPLSSFTRTSQSESLLTGGG